MENELELKELVSKGGGVQHFSLLYAELLCKVNMPP